MTLSAGGDGIRAAEGVMDNAAGVETIGTTDGMMDVSVDGEA